MELDYEYGRLFTELVTNVANYKINEKPHGKSRNYKMTTSHKKYGG